MGRSLKNQNILKRLDEVLAMSEGDIEAVQFKLFASDELGGHGSSLHIAECLNNSCDIIYRVLCRDNNLKEPNKHPEFNVSYNLHQMMAKAAALEQDICWRCVAILYGAEKHGLI